MSMQVINLEKGMPKSDEAVMKLKLELMTLRRIGVDSVKIVHGYGSTGKGGKIRLNARKYLRNLQNEGKIKFFCPGELFGPFETDGRKAIELEPALRNDSDWARSNDGITIVIL
jgi:hypothetical protein